MDDLEQLKQEIKQIKERNKRVEADKAWEESKTRITSILLMTYVITAVVFYLIGIKNFLLSALVPTLGFYLSTLSLPFIKNWWIDRFIKK